MPPEPRNATMNQRDNAIELNIRDFTVQQVPKLFKLDLVY